MSDYTIAHALAADMAGASVDPNEAQKALAYARSQRNSKALFDYLDAVVTNGRVVVRSGRTMGYYRNLQSACKHHLKPLQQNYESMLQTFAWSLRLLRYYRVVPEAIQREGAQAVPEAALQSTPPPPPPKEPELPAVGEIFTGTILDLDEDVVMIQIPDFAAEKAVGVINKPEGKRPRYRVDNSARVKVLEMKTLKNGRVVLELEPAPAKAK
jgi:hypothetical protein